MLNWDPGVSQQTFFFQLLLMLFFIYLFGSSICNWLFLDHWLYSLKLTFKIFLSQNSICIPCPDILPSMDGKGAFFKSWWWGWLLSHIDPVNSLSPIDQVVVIFCFIVTQVLQPLILSLHWPPVVNSLIFQIKQFFALAPVTTVGQMTSPLRLLADFLPEMQVRFLTVCLSVCLPACHQSKLTDVFIVKLEMSCNLARKG